VTTDQLLMLVAGIVIGVDIAMVVHLIGRHLDDRRDQRAIQQHLDALEALEVRTAALAEDRGR
jgi:hypothetical protein